MKSGSLCALPFASALAFAAFSAHAADLYGPGPFPRATPIYEAVPSWNGFYAGVNGGYGWGASSRLTTSASQDGDLVPGTAGAKLWPDGGFGGGQFGYNFQRDRIVFGLETDIQGGGIGSKTFSEAVSLDGTAVTTDGWAKSSLGWFGTVRGRVGYTFGGSLVYATGGFAYGSAKDTLTQTVTSVNPTPTGTIATNSTSAKSHSDGLCGWCWRRDLDYVCLDGQGRIPVHGFEQHPAFDE